jgi:hypothetical protein
VCSSAPPQQLPERKQLVDAVGAHIVGGRRGKAAKTSLLSGPQWVAALKKAPAVSAKYQPAKWRVDRPSAGILSSSGLGRPGPERRAESESNGQQT